jgi:hypothetical protein
MERIIKYIKIAILVKKGQQRMFKPSWRPNTSQVRVQLGIQEQSILDWMSRSHTESDFDDPYMVGKIISYGFQWYRSCFKIPSESAGIIETTGPSKSAKVLRHLLLGHRPCNFAWNPGPSCCAPPPIGARPKGALDRPPPWPSPLGCIRLSSRRPRRLGFCLSYSVNNSSPLDRFMRPPTCEINHSSTESLQLSFVLSSSCLCSLLRLQGLVFVARSTGL